MGSLDLPDEPSGAGRAHNGGADRPRTLELPDPDERGRVYEATRAYVSAARKRPEHETEPAGRVAGADRRGSAETAEEAPPDGRPEGTGRRSYWDEVPRFLQMRAEQDRRWPAGQRAAPARPGDGPGAFGAGPGPERRAETTGAIDRVREAEPGISANVEATERENGHGGWLEGFGYRLKGENRLREKVTEGLATASPDATPGQVLRLIPDAIRYTFCFEPEHYARGYYDIKERLEGRGYEMYYSKNSWTDPEYKGINTRWVAPEGQRFEVQFHTPESFHAKHHVTHAAYERIRDPATSRAEIRELHAFQREVSAWIEIPDGAADIPDFKKEGF